MPTYRLLWGVPGRSNALNIAAGLGLDPTIITAARDTLGTGQVCYQPVVMHESCLTHTGNDCSQYCSQRHSGDWSGVSLSRSNA